LLFELIDRGKIRLHKSVTTFKNAAQQKNVFLKVAAGNSANKMVYACCNNQVDR